MPEPVLEKVTAFATRGSGGSTELLVFAHPTAGVQLPAGTVEIGEAPEIAVLRELREESGLADVALVGALGVETLLLPEGERAVWETAALLMGPSLDDAPTGTAIRRGFRVPTRGVADGFTDIHYEEWDHNQRPPVLLKSREGWVPSRALTSRVKRFFYHIIVREETPDEWDLRTDGGNVFHLYWTPLRPRPRLVAGQDGWLETVYDQLLRAVRS